MDPSHSAQFNAAAAEMAQMQAEMNAIYAEMAAAFNATQSRGLGGSGASSSEGDSGGEGPTEGEADDSGGEYWEEDTIHGESFEPDEYVNESWQEAWLEFWVPEIESTDSPAWQITQAFLAIPGSVIGVAPMVIDTLFWPGIFVELVEGMGRDAAETFGSQ